MPLIRDGGFTADDWRWLGEGEASAPGQNAVIPLKRLLDEGEAAGARGVEVPNNTQPESLAPLFGRLDLIVIPFPAFNDGRGFSLGKRLRRLGFQGELRAKGHIIPDQYAYARACGFDTIEISDALAARQPEAHWREAAASMSLGYQPGYPGPQNILIARYRARDADR
ncbi:MAG: DUF934 domain-containing protein [Hyphomicrobiales bacterium]|nr:DUF934 domain-containing protein [Hyphomicrobiales bacterium]